MRIAPQRVAAIDALVFQFQHVSGEVGAVRLRYADGGERVLVINDRDVLTPFDIVALKNPVKARIGWLGLNALQALFTLLVTVAGFPVALLLGLLAGPRLPLRMAAWYWAPLLFRGAGARLRGEDQALCHRRARKLSAAL